MIKAISSGIKEFGKRKIRLATAVSLVEFISRLRSREKEITPYISRYKRVNPIILRLAVALLTSISAIYVPYKR